LTRLAATRNKVVEEEPEKHEEVEDKEELPTQEEKGEEVSGDEQAS